VKSDRRAGHKALGAAKLSAILNDVRYPAAIALGLGLACSQMGGAVADQRDPRLEVLFDQLKQAPAVEAARLVEASIWMIWGQSDDGAVRILLDQGVAAMGRNDLRGALGKFEQIVAIAPDFAEGWNKRATVYYLLGNYQKSLDDIAKTLELEPRHFGALSGRGLVYSQMGEENLALDSFEAALDVYPLAPGALQNAEALRQRLGRHDI